jgi:hypothetical protein
LALASGSSGGHGLARGQPGDQEEGHCQEPGLVRDDVCDGIDHRGPVLTMYVPAIQAMPNGPFAGRDLAAARAGSGTTAMKHQRKSAR